MQKIASGDAAADNRDLLYDLLRDEYQVFAYESGEDAVTRIAEDSPDVIILDIRMRGIDGTAVLERIRSDAQFASTPVLALTANVMAGDREKYLAAGFDEYLPKPILRVEDFVTTIRRFLPPQEPK